jgi:hypothetical protein
MERASLQIASLDVYYKYYHMISWGLPLLIAAFTFALEPLFGLGRVYVSLGVWCWISPNYSVWRLILFYGPIWLVFLYNVTAYSIIGWKLARISNAFKGSKSGSSHTSRFVWKTRGRKQTVNRASFFLILATKF